MMEAMTAGYASAFGSRHAKLPERPEPVHLVMKQAMRRSWRQLAVERIGRADDSAWPSLLAAECEGIPCDRHAVQRRGDRDTRDEPKGSQDGGKVDVLDAAYWVKGCSSLGRRYAVLLDIDGDVSDGDDLCLMDIKEGVTAAAPRDETATMPRDNAERVVEGARHLSPALGERMRAARLLDRAVVIRELLPQDLKLDIDLLAEDDARDVARYLGAVVGAAHARQMDKPTRMAWRTELGRTRAKTIDAPMWLWNSIVQLVSSHEAGIWSIAGASPPERVSPRATAEATRARPACGPAVDALEDCIRHVRRKLRRDLRCGLGDRGFRARDDGCHRGVHVIFGQADTPALRDPVARLDLADHVVPVIPAHGHRERGAAEAGCGACR